MLSKFTPRTRLLKALWALLVIGLLSAFFPPLSVVWKLGALLLAALALADVLLLRSQHLPQVERQLLANMPLGAKQQVVLQLFNPGRQHLSMRVHDQHPQDFDVQGLPQGLQLRGRSRSRVTYQLSALQRGDHRFAGTKVSLDSPFGFWSRQQLLGEAQTVRVFPNFGEISHYALLASRNRLSEAGVRRRQRRGSGSDFHQLREYQEGDSLRQIDWKATGRFHKLISREYQDEQNQQLFFLLDCGQRMRHEQDGQQHMDAALNAMLLAAHVASKQGDAVGYMTFAGEERFFAPRKGSTTVPALLRSVYDLNSSVRASDYLRMADRFMAHHLRRALVVLITNTRDGDHADLMLAVKLLRKRHLVLVADMREQVLDACLEQSVIDHEQALAFHVVQGLREAREQVHQEMRHQGAMVVDILPQQLPLALVNEYFDVKRSARL